MVNLCGDENGSDNTLFADDMTTGCSSANIENLYLMINLILDLFKKCFAANKLTDNTNKTKYILFHGIHQPVTDSHFSLYLYNVSLEKVASTWFLGVVTGESLSWKLHISNVLVKISKFISIFYRVRKVLTGEALVMLYNSLVYPHLTYCNSVWCSGPKTTIAKLFIAQKKIVRAIIFSMSKTLRLLLWSPVICSTFSISISTWFLLSLKIVIKEKICLRRLFRAQLKHLQYTQ